MLTLGWRIEPTNGPVEHSSDLSEIARRLSPAGIPRCDYSGRKQISATLNQADPLLGFNNVPIAEGGCGLRNMLGNPLIHVVGHGSEVCLFKSVVERS